MLYIIYIYTHRYIYIYIYIYICNIFLIHITTDVKPGFNPLAVLPGTPEELPLSYASPWNAGETVKTTKFWMVKSD